jgi:hypothetical protein
MDDIILLSGGVIVAILIWVIGSTLIKKIASIIIKKIKASKNIRAAIEGLVFSLFTLLIMSWPAIFCYQIYYWLKHGDWLPMPLSKAMDLLNVTYPSTSWVGAQKIIDVLLDFPIGLCSILLAIGLIFIAALVSASFESE